MGDILQNLVNAVWRTLLYPFDATQRIYWVYMLTSFVPVLWWHFRTTRAPITWAQIKEFCLPKAVVNHPSYRVDIRFFIINTALFTIPWGGYLSSNVFTAHHTQHLLNGLWGVGSGQHMTALQIIGITVALVLVLDFAVFLAHYLSHKIYFLWEFHKVHHSAEVMGPLTVYRMHPVDDALTYILGGIFTGVLHGWVQYVWASPQVLNIWGLNAVTWVFYMAFYQLRHSHIWLHYGTFLGNIFVSPAMHQIHHSSEERHWDKNMGLIFSFWDKLFGTLYNPAQKETFTLGIGAQTRHYDTVWALYTRPFICNIARFKRSACGVFLAKVYNMVVYWVRYRQRKPF